ncbi:hypothetical protein [Mycolicibacter arupensis]|nr:hypothetical protein [Mycolicibacter arupensis]
MMNGDAESAVQVLLARLHSVGVDAEIVSAAEWEQAVKDSPERCFWL